MSSTYVDGVTPLDAVHMNALQQKVEKGAPSGYVALNASSGIDLAAAAIVKWSTDTNLYRAAAGVLKTDSYFESVQSVYGNYGTAQQVGIGALGTGYASIYFGSAQDTN